MLFHVLQLCVLSVCLSIGKSHHSLSILDTNYLLTFAALMIDKSRQSVAVIANRNALNVDNDDDEEEEDEMDMRGLLEENVQEVLEVPRTGEYEDDNKPIPIRDVSAVNDGRAELPCDIDPPDPSDRVYLVLWYRELAGKPLYSFDLRGRPPNTAKHWSADPTFGFGTRANFRVGSGPETPTALVIKTITLLDEGVYRCRVDYRNSPTRNMKLNLTVVEEPHAPQIKRDTDIQQDVGGAYAGPFNEGEELKLVCEVHGGRPSPTVFWYVDDQIVNGKTQVEPGKDIVVNKLRYAMLNRDMNNKKVSCVAKNNDINDPKTRTVTVQMNLRPQSVKILRKQNFLTEGVKVQIICEARGSEPPAQIRWYIGETPAENYKVQHNPLGSTTTSILIFEPGQGDNKRRISCRAFNKNIPGSTIEDHWDVHVMYKPRLTLTLGRTLNPQEIKERDDVYFECLIVSNPEANKLEWYHQDRRLYPNATGGILLSNQSLVIQGVSQKNNGAYTCRAENRQGKATSNEINLSIKYSPVCDNKSIDNSKIAVDSSVVTIVDCYLDSNPPVSQVYWISSKQGHQSRISPSQYTLMEGFSRLSYQPERTREADFGELLCYGVNKVGTQTDPCVFSIEAAGRPYPLENCKLGNSTGTFGVICDPGFDGGLTQAFNLEIFVSETKALLRNMTRNQPKFQLAGIHSNQPVSLQVYSWNKKGRSEIVTVAESVRINTDLGSRSTELPPSLVMKEPLYLVIGGAGIGFLLITFLSLIWYFKRRAVGKKLAVVEVCVGRGVDRVRGKQEETPGVNNNRVPNNNGNVDRDSYSLPQERYDKALLPSISSERSVEDISNLQLKGSTSSAPTNSTNPPKPSIEAPDACIDKGQPNPVKVAPPPTKPILKTRKPDTGVPYTGQFDKNRYSTGYGAQDGYLQGVDGNWYTNPMDTSYFSSANYPQQEAYSSGYSTLQSRMGAGGHKYSYFSERAPEYSERAQDFPERSQDFAHRIPPPSGFSSNSSRHRTLSHIGTLPRQQSGGETDPLNYRSSSGIMTTERTSKRPSFGQGMGMGVQIGGTVQVMGSQGEKEYLLNATYSPGGPESNI